MHNTAHPDDEYLSLGIPSSSSQHIPCMPSLAQLRALSSVISEQQRALLDAQKASKQGTSKQEFAELINDYAATTQALHHLLMQFTQT